MLLKELVYDMVVLIFLYQMLEQKVYQLNLTLVHFGLIRQTGPRFAHQMYQLIRV